LQSQRGRLDPAKKSLCFKGVKEMNADKRSECIEYFLDYIGVSAVIRSIEHIAKGPYGNRSLTPVSVLELNCKSDRENALRKSQAIASELKDGTGTAIKVNRAKTPVQLKLGARARLLRSNGS